MREDHLVIVVRGQKNQGSVGCFLKVAGKKARTDYWFNNKAERVRESAKLGGLEVQIARAEIQADMWSCWISDEAWYGWCKDSWVFQSWTS